MDSSITPTPEVQHIPTIFRKINSGEIRIPSFQRGFVWTEKNILEFLESIYEGYPIGSLLFWRVEKEILHIDYSEESPFPKVNPLYPLNYVLDGLQRLTTLYAVFHSYAGKKHPFNVVFNFNTLQFEYPDPNQDDNVILSLDSLFTPKKMLEFHAKIIGDIADDTIISQSLKLQSIFQEYLIPTVTISGKKVEDVVEIFRRINSTGLSLGTVDFMRALTWSGEFDLNKELTKIQAITGDDGFIVEQETLIKLIAIYLGRNPISNDILTLRNEDASKLKNAVENVITVLQLAIKFLDENFHIKSTSMLPYEGILLGLVKVFSVNNAPSKSVLSYVSKWIWNVSFDETLRGKPDNYVARAIKILENISLNKATTIPDLKLKITPGDFLERRFINGKALSSAFAAMFANNNAHSLITGQLINPKEYMHDDAADAFIPIFSLDKMKNNQIYRNLVSSKIFPNLVVESDENRRELLKLLSQKTLNELYSDLRDRIGDEAATETLRSQFMHTSYENDEMMTFFYRRSQYFYEFASKMVETHGA